ncbi:c-type cytochrome biogenesis protein CcsB [Trichloromonas acetexigens]|jgi:cytochrome c-type biogenesis protein CcsB|uniref:Heme exporter protein C n=1 Tax=Trichloromonas acetexigens TaxID=38815 RepID=A0A550J9B1_9BACT|nr:c-type cytochrome biogenesis protein CcsB [Desulfuromonas acetexigens]TRO79786.1 c-type cytochrome biogenesis protein CcsB [Desulfuromonas acetexigens]TRO83109.1 c-type cytochrome biogenesis protein CcsB [Desulfuromonas acetexigens]
MTSSLFFNITTIAYFAAMVLFIVYIVSRVQAIGLTATGVVWAGFVANTIAIGLRWREAYALGFQQAPLSNLYESVVFFAWSIALCYLLMDLKYKQRAVGAFVIPFAFIFMIWAQLGLNAEIQPLVPALQSNWLTYHVITCFLGYAAFAVACGASIMYLLMIGREERKGNNQGLMGIFPSAKVLDDINYKAIMFGFPMLSLGIITGAAWANYAWGTYWSWDPKETWSLIIWFIYAAFLHARFTRGWVGRKAAWLSIIGFAATIFCYLGVNLLLSGLHSYGS